MSNDHSDKSKSDQPNTYPYHFTSPNYNGNRYFNSQFKQGVQNSNLNYRSNCYFYYNQNLNFQYNPHHRPLRFDPGYQYVIPMNNLNKKDANINKNDTDKKINIDNTKSDSSKLDQKHDPIENPQLDKIFKKTSKIFDKVLSDIKDNLMKENSITNMANPINGTDVNLNMKLQNEFNNNFNISKSDINNTKVNKFKIVKPLNTKINSKLSDVKSKKRKAPDCKSKISIENTKPSKKIKKTVDSVKDLTVEKKNFSDKPKFSFSNETTLISQIDQKKTEVFQSCPNNTSDNNLFIFGLNSTDQSSIFKNFNSSLSNNKNNSSDQSSLQLNDSFKNDQKKMSTKSVTPSKDKIFQDVIQKPNEAQDTTASSNDVCKLLSQYKLKKLLEGPKTRKDQIALENLLQMHYKTTQKSTKALRQQDLSNVDNLKLVPITENLPDDVLSYIDILDESVDIECIDKIDANHNLKKKGDYNGTRVKNAKENKNDNPESSKCKDISSAPPTDIKKQKKKLPLDDLCVIDKISVADKSNQKKSKKLKEVNKLSTEKATKENEKTLLPDKISGDSSESKKAKKKKADKSINKDDIPKKKKVPTATLR